MRGELRRTSQHEPTATQRTTRNVCPSGRLLSHVTLPRGQVKAKNNPIPLSVIAVVVIIITSFIFLACACILKKDSTIEHNSSSSLIHLPRRHKSIKYGDGLVI